MATKQTIFLNIAGRVERVLFDGESVFEPLFPDQKIVRMPACNFFINQEQLVEICKGKTLRGDGSFA